MKMFMHAIQVMLKNEGSVLPLRKSGQKIALVGWWVDDQDNAEGCGVIWGNRPSPALPTGSKPTLMIILQAELSVCSTRFLG